MSQQGRANFPVCPQTPQGPATANDLCNYDYVSTQDNLRALLSGDTFIGGITLNFNTPWIMWSDTHAAPISWRMGENNSGQFGLFRWNGSSYTHEAWHTSSSDGRVTFPLAPVCTENPTSDYHLARVGWINQHYVPKTGGTITGVVTFDFGTPEIRFDPSGTSSYWRVGSNSSGTFAIMTSTGHIGVQIDGNGNATFPNNVSVNAAYPTSYSHLIKYGYLHDYYYTKQNSDARYLRLTGGTLTGDLIIDAGADSEITLRSNSTDWDVGVTSSGMFGIATTGGTVAFQISNSGTLAQFPNYVSCSKTPISSYHLTRKDYVDSHIQAVQDQLDAALARIAALESA
jgi:hypothetical protein